ncbi:DUF1722 domain-containing protein [Vibrio sp. T187]|uniref:YbgA family protein n=1 Tax=Vibrio TaxID=662 RepID=UPI0010C98BEF|nr:MULTISPECIES: DUF523 and DUF1722 domain-containing protein [Vibrio]MBW3696894.1 DUF1722 domain-containing protein [Vibrio sp. T187]
MEQKLKIGISACVLGQKVRFDGGHKRSGFCTEELQEFADFKPICPEVGVGLPVPRPTIRQIKTGDVITVSRPDGTGDVTQALTDFGKKISQTETDLSGFIFCAMSPSCGMERVKVHYEHGKGSISNGVGLFAKQIMEGNPCLPVEESGRLNDPILRENFITRVFTYHKWLVLKEKGLTKHALIQFHSANKYLVMSHHVESYKALGKLLGETNQLTIDELGEQYINGLMQALQHLATRRSHTNTLQHIQGYFKRNLTKSMREELTSEISAYRSGLTPLLVPLTLINHHLREFPNEYLNTQVYLNPHPKSLRLRYGY